MQRRLPARSDRGRATRGRRTRGQSLVIFALSATVLLAIAGLAIDSTRAFDQFAVEQRAAEAGALAAVLYMPNYYNTARPGDVGGDCAITRALKEVNKNGAYAPTAGDCQNGPPSPTPNSCADETVPSGAGVTVCTVTGMPNAVQVTITEPISIYLLAFLGFTNINITATARAGYVSPFVLGEPPSNDLDTYFFGSAGSCSNGNGNSSGCSSKVSNFSVSINGPAELKESGDPYVNCAEGPSTIADMANAGTNPPYDPPVNNPPSGAQPFTNTDTGYGTNHPQSAPACGASQPDRQPTGYCYVTCNTSHPGGYSYIIQPSANALNGKTNLWIFNPQYIPYNASGKSCPGAKQIDGFFQPSDCNGYYPKYPNVGTLIAGNGDYYFDDPRFYFDVTYTLYTVYQNYDATNDKLFSPTSTWTFRPYDAMPADLSVHGCSSSQVYDFSAGSHYHSSDPAIPSASAGGCVTPVTNGTNAVCAASLSLLAPLTTPCPYQWFRLSDAGGPIVLKTPDGPNCAAKPCSLGYRLLVETSSYDAPLPGTTAQPYSPDPYTHCTSFTCGWGYHSYGVEICDQTVTDPNPTPVKNCTSGTPGFVGPLNNLDMRIIPASNKTINAIPLAYLDPSFAGRTIQVQLFDPGDSVEGSNGNTYVALVPPDTTKTCMSVPYSDAGLPTRTVSLNKPTQYPNYTICPQSKKWVQTAKASNNGPADNVYNGLWITITIQLPSDYSCGTDVITGVSDCQWWLNVYADQTNDFDELAVRFGLAGGSPIHLF